ncbi:SWIM zinc finger family protein [Streptomyces chartreusis]|uniref:SWIM zinc finger family protein n=1 Tax=Streptomyces chartreusis TaxID=1969 RepID=UPI0036954DE6
MSAEGEASLRGDTEHRPADAARRALRAARERRESEQGAAAGDESAAGEDKRRVARPGDAARAAVRPTREPDRDRAHGVGGVGASSADGPDVVEGGRDVPRSGAPRVSSEDARRPGAHQQGANRPGAEADPAEADPSGTPTEPGPEVPAPASGRPGPRPGDAAREALRAALEERRRAESDEAGKGVRGAGTSRRPASPTPSGAGDRPRRDAGGDDARQRGSEPPRRPGRAADRMRVRDVQSLLAGAFMMPSSDAPEGDEDSGLPDPADDSRPNSASPYSATPDHPRRNPASPSSAAPDHPRHSAAPPTDGDPFSAPASPPESAPSSPSSPPSPSTPPPSPLPANPAPQVPRSMAAPSRDGELRRTFPAFAARSAEDTRFAESWWGNAWVTALEEGALDAKRLARGRGYAQDGHVDAITVTPGLVLAYVRGSRPRPYRVQVRLRTLDDADWTRFLDAVAERPGHIAALLDKEMPQSLADCGVPLLPGPGDLDPRCSCPDRGHPCKHAAALCYQTARLLDADPFVLLLLRGRGERQLLDALSRLSAARAARAAQEQQPAPLAGVRATEALDPERRLPPLPAPLPVPPHPEQPPVYPAAPGGPDPFALDQLATDAAARAHAMLGTGRDPVAELTLWQDAVRLAAARPGSGLTAATRALYASLAAATDRTPADLARAVAAWRQGGFEGLAVLEEPWDPPAGRFDRARPLLLAADLPAFRPWHNRLTHPRGHVQLRLGRDGLWYPYESEPGDDDWWPRGTPDLDPVGALTGLDPAGALDDLGFTPPEA